jgi:hypothetical protein
MTETLAAKRTRIMDADGATPPLRLPDAASTAEVVFAGAMAYCAQKMKLEGPEAALDLLKQGQHVACDYCRYSMAQQVGDALGRLDENVKAVYMCEYDATPEDLCFGEAAQTSPIHLIVWTERKTGALTSLVAGLDRALAERYAQETGVSQTFCMLDAQVVDDSEVENRKGHGAMLTSAYNRPLQVWKR